MKHENCFFIRAALIAGSRLCVGGAGTCPRWQDNKMKGGGELGVELKRARPFGHSPKPPLMERTEAVQW